MTLTRRLSLVAITIIGVSIYNSQALSQTLRFSTGFEPSTRLAVIDSKFRRLIGQDESLGRGRPTSWTTGFGKSSRLGSFAVQLQGATEGGGDTGLDVDIIDDPTGSGRGKVLEFRARAGGPTSGVGRIQTNLYGNPSDMEEVTSAVKLYLHPDLAVLSQQRGRLDFFTIQEIFTNPTWGLTGRNFRITLGIWKKQGSGNKLYWAARCDEAGRGGRVFWEQDSHDKQIWVSDVLGQWITLVTYYKKGDSSTGRFRAKIISEDGRTQEVINVTNLTHHPIDRKQDVGATHHNPQKLYTATTTLKWIRENSRIGAAVIYWDDWEYWEGDAYSEFGRLSVFRRKS